MSQFGSEFAFELELCAHLESGDDPNTMGDGILARQLGGTVAEPGGRVLDIVCVKPGPEFERRLELTSETIPDAAIEAGVGPGTARYWKGAFPDEYHPEHNRSALERALEIGFFESERRNGREYVRQVARYPDWFSRIVAIENKPDLGRPGDLEAQLRTDVSLGLVDEVILATESYVTGAHLNRLPDAVGVWRVSRNENRTSTDEGRERARAEAESPSGSADDTLEIEVIREPTPRPVTEPGVEPLEYEPGRTDIAVVSPERKAHTRRRIAERAFGKGWRTFRVPGCERCDPTRWATPLPFCDYEGRLVDAESECGPSCPGHEPDETPSIDLEAERDRRTPWRRDPRGKRRRQSGLDRFG